MVGLLTTAAFVYAFSLYDESTCVEFLVFLGMITLVRFNTEFWGQVIFGGGQQKC